MKHTFLRDLHPRIDPVTRNWVIVTTGTAGRLVLGFVGSIFIARALSPVDYGIFAVLSVIASFTGALMSFGLTGASVKRVATAWNIDEHEAQRRGEIFFWVLAVIAGIIALFGVVLRKPFSNSFFGSQDQQFLLILVFVSAYLTTIGGAINTLLQATGLFRHLIMVLLINSGLTSGLAFFLYFSGHLNLVTALVILGIGTSLISLIVGYSLLPFKFTFRVSKLFAWRNEATVLLRFSRWLWVAQLLSIIASRYDVVLVNQMLPRSITGTYALAHNLASKADIVNHSLFTVILPVVASLQIAGGLGKYLRQGLRRSVLISGGIVVVILFSRPFIVFFYGEAFAPASPIFRLLLGIVILDVFATPFLLLPYAFNQPQMLMAAEGLRVITLLGLSVWITPMFGVYGVIGAKYFSRVAGLLLTLLMIRRRRQKVGLIIN